MGSNTSKTHNSGTIATELSPSKVIKEENGALDKNIMDNILLDPRSPDVNRTPLTSILNNRQKNRPIVEQPLATPVNLRKKLLNHSAKELKLLDPRSPSQFIPRTPLNMSFDGENIEHSSNQYSLDYSGVIEEASCRNFNERLANITFDDLDTETDNVSKVAVYSKLEIIADISIPNVADDEEHQLSDAEDLEPRSQTPTAPSEKPKGNDMDMDDENISPVVDPISNNKRNAVSAFSSTPISTSNNQLKSLLLKKHTKKTNKMGIFTDEATNNTSALATPAKRLAKINETDNPRTPFGSLLNRRSKSVENVSQQIGLKENTRPNNGKDENATPKKQKPTALLKHVNRSGGIRIKNDIFHD